MTCISPHIEVSKRLAFLYALQIVEGIRIFCTANVIVVLAHILRIAEIDKLVALGGSHKVDVVCEVLGIHRTEVQVNLYTCVLHRSYIDKSFVEEIWWHRHLVVSEQVLLTAVEVVDRTIQAIVKQ